MLIMFLPHEKVMISILFLENFKKNNVSNAAIYNLKSWNLWRERITSRCFILSGSLENRPYIPHLFGIFQKILK